MPQVETDSMVLFWKQPTVFSQWTPSEFTVDNVMYTSAEQWMMASKARLFGDSEMEEKILQSHSPRAQKAFGRKVRGFDQHSWEENRLSIVIEGNKAKFEQNEGFKRILLNTGDKIIAEASPMDRIWGIGLAPNNEKALNRETWRGRNLLGGALMAVRQQLREQDNAYDVEVEHS